MKYAQILCILSGGRADEATLLAAAELAKREGSLVRIVPALPLTDAVIWADAFGATYIAASALEEIAAGHAQMRQDMSLLVRRTAGALGLGHDEDAAPAIILPKDRSEPRAERDPAMGDVAAFTREPAWRLLDRDGPLTDLVVIGESTVQAEGFWASTPGQVLSGLRCPMLVVRAAQTAVGGVVAVAWDGSLPAGRAVRGALPLLAAAARIVILQDPDGMTHEEKEAGDPEQLRRYLAIQGIAAAEVQLVSGRREGKALLAAAEAAGASVIVAGAFGHSQAREFLVGGTTRTLTRDSAGPHLLLAH